MVAETFQAAGSEACTVLLQETQDDTPGWYLHLRCPAALVLAFLNDEFDELTQTPEQEHVLRTELARGNGAQLREMIDHVLVCKEERGFDPIVRLAAYSFAHEMFDLSRLASFTERVSLETAVVGTVPTENMAARWGAILKAHKAAPFAQRSDLFRALLEDANSARYPFELSMAREYPSISQMLKAFVAEMVRTRALLRRCPACGRYLLAAEDACTCGSFS
ncbi:MAG: hypothetical protein LBB50_05055 [Oscillospiraceae bacterium]|jgi:hypothetical protein|nr:hypothetical protein [Oscillospiraceae bacterium]